MKKAGVIIGWAIFEARAMSAAATGAGEKRPHEATARTAEEIEAIARARAERKAKHAARGLGKINKHDPNLGRYKMVISYDGRNFHGWQKQSPPNGPPLRTIEGVLEECLRPVLSQNAKFWPAGRTDAGVSASGQVVQFDAVFSEEQQQAEHVAELAAKFNAALPTEVRVKTVAPTSRIFCANECKWKRYIYRIPADEIVAKCQSMVGEGRREASAVAEGSELAGSSITPGELLELNDMRNAAAQLLGTHDFASFQSKGGRVSTVRTLHRCDVSCDVSDGLTFTLEGNGFLYNMVRIIVGTLVQIGMRRASSVDIPAILEAADRAKAGPTAPAEGLCLDHVEYDRDWGEKA